MQNWEEIRTWRKTQRAALIERRLAAPREDRQRWDEAITGKIAEHLTTCSLVGFYWPFKGEYDPRALMRSLHARGVRLALPVVIAKATPLIFREWWPGRTMAKGVWDIPIPADGEPVLPDCLVIPLVGFDRARYRLGYGGGFYDRTLASMRKKPATIGVGYELSQLETIYPQPFDMMIERIATEERMV